MFTCFFSSQLPRANVINMLLGESTETDHRQGTWEKAGTGGQRKGLHIKRNKLKGGFRRV